MNPILQALESGPRSYGQLKSLRLYNLDYLLNKHLRCQEIILYPAVDGVPARFGLPIIKTDAPIPVDAAKYKVRPRKPKLTLSGPTKVCATCGKKKRINQFGWVRNPAKRKSTCYVCYNERYKGNGG